MADLREDRTRPREWLAIPADDATAELVAVVLEAGATTRRQAGLAIAEELMAEKREQGKDIRSGAVKLAEVLAEASTLERVARQVRDRHLPAIDVDATDAIAQAQAIAALLSSDAGAKLVGVTPQETSTPPAGWQSVPVTTARVVPLGPDGQPVGPPVELPVQSVTVAYDADAQPPQPSLVAAGDTPTAHEVPLEDGRTAWVADVETVAAALGIDEGDEVPEVDEPDPADVVPIDPEAQ